MELSVYSIDDCYPCELLKLFLDNSKINYVNHNINELKFPVCAPYTLTKNNDSSIEGFDKDTYCKWLKENGILITYDIECIFNETIKAIINEDIIKFKMLLKLFPEVKLYTDGWNIVHYLFDQYWFQGIVEYILQKGDINLKTLDKIYSVSSIPLYMVGGRSVLHILIEKKMYSKYDKWIKKIKPEIDNNGDYPIDLKNKNIVDTNAYKKIRKRMAINFDFESTIKLINVNKFIDGVFVFEIDDNIVSNMKNKLDKLKMTTKNISPNSMHKYGMVLNDTDLNDDIMQISKSCLKYFKSFENFVSMFSFYIEYSDNMNVNLDSHEDDSYLTINVCLDNDSEGADLIFDDCNVVYKHKSNYGLFHRGNITHHVTKLNKGKRKNIIIWLK